MNSSEFMDYITTPLTYEQMHLLYRANNIKYERCNLYHDFIISLNKTINDICVDLETRIFVEDMDVEDERIIKQYKPEAVDDKIII